MFGGAGLTSGRRRLLPAWPRVRTCCPVQCLVPHPACGAVCAAVLGTMSAKRLPGASHAACRQLGNTYMC